MTNNEAAAKIDELADMMMNEGHPAAASILVATAYSLAEPDHSHCLAKCVAGWMAGHEPDVFREINRQIAESN